MTADLPTAVGRIRAALGQEPDSYTFARFPPGLPPGSGPDLPPPLREVLEITNGPRAGVVALAPAERIPQIQYYLEYCDEVETISSNPSAWICIGTISDEPLLLRRDTGEVWWFPDTGTLWYMSDRFERLTPDLTTFMIHHLLGAGYRQLSPLPDDDWHRFLRKLGLAS